MGTQTVSDWKSEIQRRRAALLNNLLLAATVCGLVLLIVYPFVLTKQGKGVQEILGVMVVFFAGWLVVLVAWVWRGLPHVVRASVFLLVTYALGFFVFRIGGLPGGGRTWVLLFPVLGLILAGPGVGIAGGVVSILTYAFFALAFSQKWIPAPDVAEDLTALGPWMGEGAGFLLVVVILTVILWLSNRDWVQALIGAGTANRDLATRTRELEKTNAQLNQQASQLRATAEIAQAGSSILDPDTLAREVVNRIQEGFSSLGVYYVGLFLLDETREHAALQAATGDAGRLLLEMGHKLEVDETSTLGWCIVHQEARMALNLEEGSVQLDILPMPHTRSEIALPLRSHGRVLGALSVQSTHETAFAEANASILQMVADQVATAIDNAQLFSQTQAALQEVQAAHRRYLVQAWREFLATRPTSRVDYIQPGAETGNGELLRQTQRAAVTYQRTIAAGSPPADAASTLQAVLVVPLKLRGQVIGTMALHETRRQRPWTAEDVALAETIAEQVTLTVENLRLMDEAQRRVVRERAIREISDRMQQATDMETLMRVTTEELNQALSGDHTYVRLSVEASPGPSPDDGRTSEGEDRSAR
jgi:GAF domain-containing protein